MGWWFDVLKFAGAAYLVYLGIRLLRAKGELLTEIKAAPKGGFFLQGFVVILSNPKVLLVFGALIPQFIDPTRDFVHQLIFLGATFMRNAIAARRFEAFRSATTQQWKAGSEKE